MYPLFAWDLSTNGASYDGNLGSAAQVRYYWLQIEFSIPTPKPLTALYFMEYRYTPQIASNVESKSEKVTITGVYCKKAIKKSKIMQSLQFAYLQSCNLGGIHWQWDFKFGLQRSRKKELCHLTTTIFQKDLQ